MTDPVPLRWHQRLANYRRAVDLLGEAVALGRERVLSGLEKAGLSSGTRSRGNWAGS